MGPALVFFIQKRKIGGHASSFFCPCGMQFSTNFRPPKTDPPRQKIDKNRRKFIKNYRKMHKNHKKMKIYKKSGKIAKKHEKNVIFDKNQ
jgi:hypothetical protein